MKHLEYLKNHILRIIESNFFLTFWLSLLLVFFIKSIENINYEQLQSICSLISIIFSLSIFLYLFELKESYKGQEADYIRKAKRSQESASDEKLKKKFENTIRWKIYLHVILFIICIYSSFPSDSVKTNQRIAEINYKINKIDSIQILIWGSIDSSRIAMQKSLDTIRSANIHKKKSSQEKKTEGIIQCK